MNLIGYIDEMQTKLFDGWIQNEWWASQIRLGFGANQVLTLNKNQYVSYQPQTSDTKTEETALMPDQIILRGDFREELTNLFKKSGAAAIQKERRGGCSKIF